MIAANDADGFDVRTERHKDRLKQVRIGETMWPTLGLIS
jgi:hypothetical protein